MPIGSFGVNDFIIKGRWTVDCEKKSYKGEILAKNSD